VSLSYLRLIWVAALKLMRRQTKQSKVERRLIRLAIICKNSHTRAQCHYFPSIHERFATRVSARLKCSYARWPPPPLPPPRVSKYQHQSKKHTPTFALCLMPCARPVPSRHLPNSPFAFSPLFSTPSAHRDTSVNEWAQLDASDAPTSRC